MKKIIVTGALGQIGSELVEKLRSIYGEDNILATDIRKLEHTKGPFEILDVTDGQRMHDLAKDFGADTMMHLAALLSATAERNPLLAWNLNMGGLMNALEVSRELNLQFFYTELNRCIWSINTEGQYATGYVTATYNDVWCEQSSW